MAEGDLHPYSYWVVRYTPNLVRDEWLNVGVMLFDPQAGRFETRFIEENQEFGRVRKLHPNADQAILSALATHFQTDIGDAEDPAERLEKLEQTLSNVVQLSPSRGLLAEDFALELDRLYQQHVAPPRRMSAAGRWLESGRGVIRRRLNDLLDRAGLAKRVERRVRVEDFTYRGDPLRLDYGYRYNGDRGFAQALSLERDASEAKVFAYTAGRIRLRLPSAEFSVIAETTPQPENDRQQFIVRLLDDQEIGLIPPDALEGWVNRLRTKLIQ